MTQRRRGERLARGFSLRTTNLKTADDRTLPVIDGSAHIPMSRVELAALYQRIRYAHTDERGLVLEVIGAHPGAGVTSIANGIGHAAAELDAQRVLLCDATEDSGQLQHRKLAPIGSPQLVSIPHATVPYGVSACRLDPRYGQSEMPGIPGYAEALNRLRMLFDLIVIDAPPGNMSALGPRLSRHADAVLVVVEAEKTRRPLITGLLRSITDNGGKVAGVVLNKRVQHIPDRIYRWL